MQPEIDRRVVEQYVTAFETSDLGLLTGLLRRDVALEMPPIPTWFEGREDVLAFFDERVMRSGLKRRFRVIETNGGLGVAAYSRHEDGRFHAHSIQVLEIEDGGIRRVYAFLDPSLFAAYGLPPAVD